MLSILSLLGPDGHLAWLRDQMEKVKGDALKPRYVVTLDHGRRGILIRVAFVGEKRIANKFHVNVGTGVQAHQYVDDDAMVVTIKRGVVVFTGVRRATKRRSQRAVINLVGKKDHVSAEVLVPESADIELDGGIFQVPAILRVPTAKRLVPHFLTDDVAIARAEKLGYRLIPPNMMLVPKVPAEPKPADAPIAEPPPPRDTVKITVKKPAKRRRTVTHQKAPKRPAEKKS